jgi:hypothetical protein
MAYINLGSMGAIQTKRSLWQKIRWERLALLAINVGLWALIASLFS